MVYADDDGDIERNGYFEDRQNEFKSGSNINNHAQDIINNKQFQNFPNSDLKHMITNSYFCFRCGAIMTTKEDQKHHEIFELNKPKHVELDGGY
jgi:hypothetical protein